MARTDNLTNYLTDVATAIKTKKGDNTPIKASEFDTEIANLQTGGGDIEEYFETTITSDNRVGFFSGLMMKKFPTFKVETTDLTSAFHFYKGTVYPELDTTGVTNMSNMFSANSNAEELPYLNTSSVTDMSYMFANCIKLKSLKQYDTSKVKNMSYLLQNCSKITTFPQWDYSSVTNTSYMCTQTSISTVPDLTISSVTNCSYMFQTCTSLTTIGNLTFNSAQNFSSMFSGCSSLVSVGEIDMSSATNVSSMFTNCKNVTTLGGFKDLGKAFLTTQSQGHSYCTLTLSACTKLTEQSIINVLNGLYDIASKGCKTQKCVLGSTNLAKLTSEAGIQAKANAEAKGWVLS